MWLGAGFGLAALGRPRRGAAWLALVILTFALVRLSVWFIVAAAAVYVASLVDAIGMVGIHRGAALGVRVLLGESFRIPSTSMNPTLEIGDHLFVKKRGSVDVGEVMVFEYPCDPNRDYIQRVIARGGDSVEVRCDQVYVNGKPLPGKLIESGETCRYMDRDYEAGRWFEHTCSRYRETIGDRTYEVFQDAERPARAADPTTAGSSRDFPSRQFAFLPSCTHTDMARPSGPEPLGKIVETKSESVATACEPQLHYVVPADHLFVLGDNRHNANDSRIWGSVPTSAIKGPVVGIWGTAKSDGWTFSRFGGID